MTETWAPDGFRIVPLGPDTWDEFAQLITRNNGIFGGCWCIGYHPEAAGGGSVEAISETTDGRVAHGRFLFTGTVELLEDLGFSRVRQVGKHAWILTSTLD